MRGFLSMLLAGLVVGCFPNQFRSGNNPIYETLPNVSVLRSATLQGTVRDTIDSDSLNVAGYWQSVPNASYYEWDFQEVLLDDPDQLDRLLASDTTSALADTVSVPNAIPGDSIWIALRVRAFNTAGDSSSWSSSPDTLLIFRPFLAPAVAELTQAGYRARGDRPEMGNWSVAENTDWANCASPGDRAERPDCAFQIRFVVDETAGGEEIAVQFRLQYSLNGGTWTNVTGNSDVLRAVDSDSVGEEDPTTRQLTSGSGSFVAGARDNFDGLVGTNGQIDFFGDELTEVEYNVLIISETVAVDDSIRMRVIREGGVLDSYLWTPVVSVFSVPDTVPVPPDPPQVDSLRIWPAYLLLESGPDSAIIANYNLPVLANYPAKVDCCWDVEFQDTLPNGNLNPCRAVYTNQTLYECSTEWENYIADALGNCRTDIAYPPDIGGCPVIGSATIGCAYCDRDTGIWNAVFYYEPAPAGFFPLQLHKDNYYLVIRNYLWDRTT